MTPVMADIHPSSIVHPGAELASDVKVGPFCVIGDKVRLGVGCILHSNVVLDGPSTFGKGNEFSPGCVIGTKTQDLKYTGEPTFLEVGDYNVFRENTNVNRGTAVGGKTIIGSHNLFLISAHIGHDCVLSDHIILSGFAVLAGHVTVGDYAIVSGCSAVHQFVRIGEHSMTGGVARVVQDVPPYMISEGHPAAVRSINVIGLRRRGFSEEDIKALKQCYKKIFLHKGTSLHLAIETLEADEQYCNNSCLKKLITFLQTSERGFGH